MDNELLSYAFLLQAWYTHRELKELLARENAYWAHELWKNTKLGKFPILSAWREEKIKEKMNFDEEEISNILTKNKVEIVTLDDARYPSRLKSIHHAPAFFYLKGKVSWETPMIGVVWSRRHTSYAEKILEKILPDIIQNGLWIVSWWATWVDTLGHEICLKNNWYTLVVLWTGIDVVYPSKNAQLFDTIIERDGGILSHFPLFTGPEQYNFPMRNEIVAALSSGILIPEAALSSGTLITAQLALEHGRDVFAVPWDIDRSTSEGTNMLIATGQAKCVRCSWDILEEYFDVKNIWIGMSPIIKKSLTFWNEYEKYVYEKIELWFHTIDELVSSTGYELTDISWYLAMLEINGVISIDEIGKYQIK